MVIEWILFAIAFLSLLPAGLILRRLCDDELVDGRKWFKLIFGISLLLGVLSLFVFPSSISIALTFFYITGVSWISVGRKK